ncbi:MAG: bifunctional diguanylate cyclase/phosphodiesterase [Thermodesulfovibrionales bacterium]|jgi:diguanylate cyclase (GGDEF)-like protein|nr:bifunctional diguanylate cyclase/phosphodiesterase [Thermodesulfovibrionales bacterium]RJR07147.1 MAG: GGDEF domain-containing protein [Candidatus Parcubacteria bacterium]
MTSRSKWDVVIDSEDCISENRNSADGIDRQTILELLDNNSLTTHFQPIFSSKDGTVYGYEALTRIKEDRKNINIGELFKKAIVTDTISSLDVKCRGNAISLASSLGINHINAYLFINICPEALTDPAHSVGITDELADEWDISKERIILEVTEESAIHNCKLFKEAIAYYKKRGYKIAIDDFGAGYGGLKMLSVIEPDFVKIDHHFISNIDKATVKFNLVDSIASACHRIGIKVIAEGIEQEEELKVVMNMGIDLLQGYYLYKPSPILNGDRAEIPILHSKKANYYSTNGEQCFIGDIAHRIDPIPPSAHLTAAFNRFIKNPELRSLPVTEDDRVVGMLHRNRFLENNVLGKYGYGMHLNATKCITDIMEQPSLMVEANTTLEDVAQRLQSRRFEFLYDDICITKTGKYFGTVAVHILLDAITERSLILARNANPLTGLPGNESIQREINKRLSQNMHFDVCYIDIDNFKPYNDHYGFEKGDMVIKTLACIIEETIKQDGFDFSFAGHIGGDDFIVIIPPQISIPVCEKIISEFDATLPALHDTDDYNRGCYVSKNRKNEEETFNLLSISIGIVSTEVYKITSFAHLASIATEVKKAAKMKSASTCRSSIVRDRRLMG